MEEILVMSKETLRATPVVTINDKQIEVIEYNSVPVITLRMMDELHNRFDGAAQQAFKRNEQHLIEGEDFHKVPYEEWSKILNQSKRLDQKGGYKSTMTFLTQTGYLLLVKTFNDVLAWKIQRQLVNAYFQRQKETVAQVLDSKTLDKMTRQLRRIAEAKSMLSGHELHALKRQVLKDLPVPVSEIGNRAFRYEPIISAIKGISGQFSPKDIHNITGVDAVYCRKMLSRWSKQGRYVRKVRHGRYVLV